MWSAEGRDKNGVPTRDPGSISYTAAIETAASSDTSDEIPPFAQRVLRETARRRYFEADRPEPSPSCEAAADCERYFDNHRGLQDHNRHPPQKTRYAQVSPRRQCIRRGRGAVATAPPTF